MSMKQLIFSLFVFVFVATSCEKDIASDSSNAGNVTLTFTASNSDVTRSAISGYFSKLNVQVFDATGAKVFDKVKTQTSADADFGSLSVQLSEGTYWVVAVGHSSTISATIKSMQMVQFTASDGQKLTDTFCCCQQIVVTDEPEHYDMTMHRVSAMFRVVLTDDEVPDNVARWQFSYTGGSANFNPTTSEGTTKSTQSEVRPAGGDMAVYTFPYMATTGVLKMTLSALSADGSVIRQREWAEVPVTRNRITTYRGHFFEEGDGNITQSGFGFTVNGQWEGEDTYEF